MGTWQKEATKDLPRDVFTSAVHVESSLPIRRVAPPVVVTVRQFLVQQQVAERARRRAFSDEHPLFPPASPRRELAPCPPRRRPLREPP